MHTCCPSLHGKKFYIIRQAIPNHKSLASFPFCGRQIPAIVGVTMDHRSNVLMNMSYFVVWQGFLTFWKGWGQILYSFSPQKEWVQSHFTTILYWYPSREQIASTVKLEILAAIQFSFFKYKIYLVRLNLTDNQNNCTLLNTVIFYLIVKH